MTIRALAVVLTITVGVSGCGIETGTFYAPSATEGDVAGYGGWYAPKDLHLTRGNRIHITVDGGMFVDSPEKNNRFFIEIWVPADESLQVPIKEIRVTTPDSAATTALTAYASPLHSLRRPADKLSGDETELKGDRYPGETTVIYDLYETFDGPKPDLFYVDLPGMRAGGQSYPPLRIQFKKTHGWWVQAFM
jgi:hypothetical protein